jgi:hypothetical protein
MTELLEQNGQHSAVAGVTDQVTWEALQTAVQAAPAPAAPKAPLADPTLESALITFQTGTDNKEPASIIEVVVRNRRNEMVARASDSYGEFKNFSTHGPFSLDILAEVARGDLTPGGTVWLTFTPQHTSGVWPDINDDDNDEWKFNFYIDMVFSDGSHLAVSENGLDMSPKSTQRTMGL